VIVISRWAKICVTHIRENVNDEASAKRHHWISLILSLLSCLDQLNFS